MAAETLIPVDIESEARAELLARLPGLGYPTMTVATKIPSPRPAEFVRVVSLGGTSRDLVTDLALIRIEAFAAKETTAERLCAIAFAALQAAARDGSIGAAVCYSASVQALPSNLPLPSVPDRHRYIAQLTLAVRRTTA